jgi:hypothetical protein
MDICIPRGKHGKFPSEVCSYQAFVTVCKADGPAGEAWAECAKQDANKRIVVLATPS